MSKLTPKQQLFADFYLQHFNGTKAAKQAGYSEKTAYAIAYENLNKPQIKQYIEEKYKAALSVNVASIDETMAYFTGVMRGEVKDQFELDTSIKDRNEAAKEIKKRHEKIEDKIKGNNTSLEKLDALLDKMNEVANE